MTFLLNWLRRLGSFIINIFRKQKTNEIPDSFDNQELIVRGIFSPLFYSARTGKLKEGAFLPPPSKKDVSVLRRHFTNDDFCKNHCIKIKISGNSYTGLATFLANHIKEIAQEQNLEDIVYLKFTPLDANSTIITSRPVLVKQSGVPMHADIYYEADFENGKPQTKFRQFAKKLAIGVSNYFDDPFPLSQNWQGLPLTWKEN